MTEYKKLIYKVEDTIALGKSLPVVAMRQLPKLAKEFEGLQDIQEYKPGTQALMSAWIMAFYNNNEKLLDDERELKKIFTQYSKLEFFLNIIKVYKKKD